MDKLKIFPLDVPSGAAKFDLALCLEERSGSFHGVLEYRKDLFDEETIRRWAGYYQSLIKSALLMPGAAIGDLEMLGPLERQKVMDFSLGEARPLGASQSFRYLFEQKARRFPASPALRWNGEAWSYEELNKRANRLAHALRAEGLGRESILAIVRGAGAPGPGGRFGRL